MERFRLDGRVAVVSGASRGIGAGIAVALAEAGADIGIGARDGDRLAEVAAAIETHGRRAHVVTGSLHEREGLATLVQSTTEALGAPTVAVNNVGGSMPGPFLAITEKQFEAALRWNVTTAFSLTQLVVPAMLEAGGGSVVNIASSAGRHASRGFTAYGTAKAAMIQLTRTMAADLAPKVRVNAIAPGAIVTDALAGVLNEDLRSAMEAGTPMRRIGEVEDIAAAAVYLASDASSYVTGQILPVDGGIQTSNFDMGIDDL